MTTPFYPPYISGVTRYAQWLAEALAAAGCQVNVVTVNPASEIDDRTNENGVTVHRLPATLRWGKGALSARLVPLLETMMDAHDILLLHSPHPHAATIARRTVHEKLPLLVVHHCDLTLPPGVLNGVAQRWMRLGQQHAARYADAVVVNSMHYAAASPILRSCMDKVHVVPPPVALGNEWSRIDPLPPPSTAANIGLVARWSAEKGIDVMLRAWPRIIAARPDARLILAGPTRVPGERAYARRLRRILRPWIERGSVSVRDTVSDVELEQLYRDLHVLVTPSINATESFGLTQIEALRARARLVASDLPGVREAVLAIGPGELAAPGDSSALAMAILRQLRQPRPQAPNRSALARHDPAHSAAHFIDLMQGLQSLGSGAPAGSVPTKTNHGHRAAS